MHNVLLIAILAGLGGMLGWGLADFFAKKTVDAVGPIKSLVWANCFGTALLIILAAGQLLLGRQLDWPHGPAVWLGLAGFGVLQMVIYWLLYRGFEKGQLAVLNPIFASFTGLVALVAILGFGEKANAWAAISLPVIFAGILLLNLDLKGLRSKRLKVAPGLKEVGAATILAAGWTLGWDKFVSGHDSLSYALWMYVFMALAAAGLARLLRSEIKGVPGSAWLYLALIGGGEAVAYLAVSWGYSSTSLTGVVALISGAFSVPTVILAYVFLEERLNRLQLLGIVAIIAGIVGISIS